MKYITFQEAFFNESNDRHRVVEGLKNRDEANRLKQFEYNGTGQDYDKKTFDVADPREKRQIIRYNEKHKYDPQPERHPAESAAARYSNINRAVGVNTRIRDNIILAKGGTMRPVMDHETQHYNQDMIARKNFGVQGSRMMFNKETNRNAKDPTHDSYHKSSLEYNANKTAVDPIKPSYQDTKNIVAQNIQSKYYSGPRTNPTVAEGDDYTKKLRAKSIYGHLWKG